jgi:hypothetical protein
MLHRAFAIARIAVFAGAVCHAFGQVPTVIEIDIENYAYYYADNPDYSKLAGSEVAVPPVSTKTFSSFIGLADIVQVNGKPARGTWSIRATTTNYTPTPQPGQAIADTTRNVFVDWVWEIQQADGTPIGTIMATGMGFGPPPPGSPLGLSPTAASSMAITGGTGAFLGVRGQAGFSAITVTGRAASVTEDPSLRRTLGGGTRSFLLTLIPLASPAILSGNAGPLVLHAEDFSPVSSKRPAVPSSHRQRQLRSSALCRRLSRCDQCVSGESPAAAHPSAGYGNSTAYICLAAEYARRDSCWRCRTLIVVSRRIQFPLAGDGQGARPIFRFPNLVAVSPIEAKN